MINNHVIGIQAFVKVDTLTKLIDSLFSCVGIEKYNIFFLVDSMNKSYYQNRQHWNNNNENIIKIISNLQQTKPNINILCPNENLGCYMGCQRLIDECMKASDYVIFLEDDMILGKDALIYYENIFDKYVSKEPYWLGGVCSSNPNGQRGKNESTNLDNLDKIGLMDWIHSAEFAITKQIWLKYRDIRSARYGDRDMAFKMRQDGLYSIIPKISRSCRIGYNHPDGYSIYNNHPSEIQSLYECIPESNLYEVNNTISFQLSAEFSEKEINL